MAALSANIRARIAAGIQRQWSELRESVAFTKAELSAAVAAADDWREANAASYNAALPAAFRNKATAAQKTLLLCYVIMRAAGLIGPGDTDE